MRRALAAGAIYFAAVFAVGFCLGVLRTLVVQPLIGDLPAVAIELPVILAAAWLVCARMLRRAHLAYAGAGLMGATAFALLMLGEAAISVLLVGRSLAGHVTLYAQAPHLLGLAGQVVFALLPLIRTLQIRRLSTT
jgi:hypothetical protein